MTCSESDCTRRMFARGWCKLHYERWWRVNGKGDICLRARCHDRRVAEGLCARHLRIWLDNQSKWTMEDKILDWLALDGGWLTKEGIASDLGHHVDSVTRTLRNLRERGLVEARIVELAHFRGGHDQRTEWRRT